MREIKFRGISKETNEWVFGYYIVAAGMPFISVFGAREPILIIPETLGQYTGIKDKNDKEIYEGDIIECVSWNEFFSNDGKPMEALRRKMEVVFYNGAFKMKESFSYGVPSHYWDIICNGDVEIIGNIYDNPKLLKEVKE